MNQDKIIAARRHSLLVALSIATAYTAPIRALRDQLESVGYPASLDLLRTDASWLAEQGLITLTRADVLQLTERGRDVVMGYSVTHGVKRPEPGEVDSLTAALTATGDTLQQAGVWPKLGA